MDARARRSAIAAAGAGTVVAVIAAVLYFSPLPSGAILASVTVPAALVVIPPLMVIAAGALLRTGGLIGRATAVSLPVAAFAAGGAGAATIMRWGAEESDGPAPPPGDGLLTLALFLSAWTLAALVVAVVIAAALRPAGLPSGARVAIGAAAGLVAAPIIGLAFVQPGGAILCAGSVLAAALLVGHRPVPAPERREAVRAPARPDRVAALLALGGATGALAALVFAFAGGPLRAFGMDGTEALVAGLGVGALAGVPVALAAAHMRPRGRPFPRSAAALLVAGLVVSGVDQLTGPVPADGSTVVPMIAASLLASGGAVLLRPSLPGGPAMRTALAALAALGFLATAGLLAALAVAFLVPVAGVLIAWASSIRVRAAATS